MTDQIKKKLLTEFIWLSGIIVVSAALEYLIIFIFELHPLLNVKIQGLLGLIVIGYVIRMIARMVK